MRLASVLVLAVGVMIAIPLRAHAQNAPVARQLFNEGLAAVAKNDWGTAYSKFLAAHELAPEKTGVTFNLALAAAQTGRLASAQELFREYLGKTRNATDAPTEALRTRATAELEKLDRRVPSLRISIDGLHTDVDEVLVNGSKLDKILLGQRIPVDPTQPGKPYRVEIRRLGKELAVREFEIKEGAALDQSITVETYVPIKLTPVVDPITSPVRTSTPLPVGPEERRDEGGSILRSGWFWTGVAVVALGAGAAYYATRIYVPDPTAGNVAGGPISVR